MCIRDRDIACLHRRPGRDALQGGREPAVARGAGGGDVRSPAADLDLRAPRLPEGAPDELPGPGERSARCGLPDPDRPEGRELRRAPGGGPDERRAEPVEPASRPCLLYT